MNIALCVFGLILMVVSFKLFTFIRGIDVKEMNQKVYDEVLQEGKIKTNLREVNVASAILRGALIGLSFAILAVGIWALTVVFL